MPQKKVLHSKHEVKNHTSIPKENWRARAADVTESSAAAEFAQPLLPRPFALTPYQLCAGLYCAQQTELLTQHPILFAVQTQHALHQN